MNSWKEIKLLFTILFAVLTQSCAPQILDELLATTDISNSTGFTASVTPGDKKATLTWPSVSGAKSYQVQFGTTSGTYTFTSSQNATSPYTISNLTNGTTYYFLVSATDSSGNFFSAPEVKAVPLPPPSTPPTKLTVNPGNGTITVKWTASTGATRYTVKYGLTSGSYTTVASNSATSPYTISGLTNNTKYYIVVSGVNDAGSLDSQEIIGNPGWHNQVCVTTSQGQSVMGFDATALSDTALFTLTGGSSGIGSNSYPMGITFNPVNQQLVESQWDNNIRSFDTSQWTTSENFFATTPNIGPAPTSSWATGGWNLGVNPISITFDAVHDTYSLLHYWGNGGGTAAYYVVTINRSNGNVLSQFNVGSGATHSSSVLYIPDFDEIAVSRPNDIRFYSRSTSVLQRTLSGGSSQLNNPIAMFWDSANQILYVANNSANSVLGFNNYLGLNGSSSPYSVLSGANTLLNAPQAVTINNYRTESGNPELLVLNSNSTLSSFALPPAGTSNAAPLKTITNAGISNWWINMTMCQTAPPIPGSFSGTPSTGWAQLSWNAVTSATSYNIKRSTISGGPYTTISTAGSVTGTTYTDKAVTAGTPYYYVITTVNPLGESSNSSQITVTP